MSKVLLQTTSVADNFWSCPCPVCGTVEMLDAAIEDFWDCDACGHSFYITSARIITDQPLVWSRVVFDDGGYLPVESVSLTNK